MLLFIVGKIGTVDGVRNSALALKSLFSPAKSQGSGQVHPELDHDQVLLVQLLLEPLPLGLLLLLVDGGLGVDGLVVAVVVGAARLAALIICALAILLEKKDSIMTPFDFTTFFQVLLFVSVSALFYCFGRQPPPHCYH